MDAQRAGHAKCTELHKLLHELCVTSTINLVLLISTWLR